MPKTDKTPAELQVERERIKVAPKYLSKKSKVWFCDILDDYDLETHHLEMLAQAAECLDRMDESRKAIKKYGVLIESEKETYNKDGDLIGVNKTVKQNPAIGIERDNKKLYAQLCRELRLDHEDIEPGRRPRLPEGR